LGVALCLFALRVLWHTRTGVRVCVFAWVGVSVCVLWQIH